MCCCAQGRGNYPSAPSQITSTSTKFMKHKVKMINGSKQFSTCHGQREIWCRELHFSTKDCPSVKCFPNATIIARQLFLRRQTPEGGGVRNFFPGAQLFSTPPPVVASGWILLIPGGQRMHSAPNSKGRKALRCAALKCAALKECCHSWWSSSIQLGDFRLCFRHHALL